MIIEITQCLYSLQSFWNETNRTQIQKENNFKKQSLCGRGSMLTDKQFI